MMKSIVFFNNKGGVGKTTLTCNVVSFLSKHMGKRVLLIDADPQCNATQAILSENQCEEMYINGNPLKKKTLFDYLAPIEAGDSRIFETIEPISSSENKYQIDLIPGHPKMSLVEDQLSSAWSELQAGTPSGYRVTNWCSQLFNQVQDKYDLIVFDVGPSLGALNRTVILSSDNLITPLGCDIFSILGVQNITSWISAWKRQYDRAIAQVKEDRPEIIQSYPLIHDTSKKFRFAGYSVQQYVTRSFKSGKRPVKAYDRIMNQIPIVIEQNLLNLRPTSESKGQVNLGDIPFLYSLVPLAQAERSPIHELNLNARLVGSQYQQVEDYRNIMKMFCEKLMTNIGEAI